MNMVDIVIAKYYSMLLEKRIDIKVIPYSIDYNIK